SPARAKSPLKRSPASGTVIMSPASALGANEPCAKDDGPNENDASSGEISDPCFIKVPPAMPRLGRAHPTRPAALSGGISLQFNSIGNICGNERLRRKFSAYG